MKIDPLTPAELVPVLMKHKVPGRFRHWFKSHFAVVTMIRDYETDIEQVFNWLAYEMQNDNRKKVVMRLYQRYRRLRDDAEAIAIEGNLK